MVCWLFRVTLSSPFPFSRRPFLTQIPDHNKWKFNLISKLSCHLTVIHGESKTPAVRYQPVAVRTHTEPKQMVSVSANVWTSAHNLVNPQGYPHCGRSISNHDIANCECQPTCLGAPVIIMEELASCMYSSSSRVQLSPCTKCAVGLSGGGTRIYIAECRA